MKVLIPHFRNTVTGEIAPPLDLKPKLLNFLQHIYWKLMQSYRAGDCSRSQYDCLLRAQQVCGWSPPGLQSGRHHRRAAPAAYYLPSSSRFYPGEEPVHTKEHDVKRSRRDNVPSPPSLAVYRAERNDSNKKLLFPSVSFSH